MDLIKRLCRIPIGTFLMVGIFLIITSMRVKADETLPYDTYIYDYYGDVRTVDVTVRRLREKIEDNPSHPTWIVTRRGVGYYLRKEQE